MKRKMYWDKCGDLYLVYTWSKKYNRFINTHAWNNQRDAALTVRIK